MDIFFIIYLLVLTALFIAGFAFVDNLKKRGGITRALNMSLFLVTLPREAFSAGQGQSQRPEKEIISIMEHLYSSFTNLHSKGWNKFLKNRFREFFRWPNWSGQRITIFLTQTECRSGLT